MALCFPYKLGLVRGSWEIARRRLLCVRMESSGRLLLFTVIISYLGWEDNCLTLSLPRPAPPLHSLAQKRSAAVMYLDRGLGKILTQTHNYSENKHTWTVQPSRHVNRGEKRRSTNKHLTMTTRKIIGRPRLPVCTLDIPPQPKRKNHR